MTVYVDNARRRLGRMVMCHMLADTERELETMAKRIGCRWEWFQGDHFDVPLFRKAAALRLGALEVTQRQMVALRKRYRAEYPVPDYTAAQVEAAQRRLAGMFPDARFSIQNCGLCLIVSVGVQSHIVFQPKREFIAHVHRSVEAVIARIYDGRTVA